MNVETFFLDKNELLATLQSKFSPRISFASLKQTHSAKVLEVKDAANFDTPDADAFVTKLVDVALTIHTADCLPLLAYDTGEANMIVGTGKSVIGACHGGWRGVSKGIIKNWISALVSLGANAKNLKVLIGPSIGPCHFEVGADVAEQLYEVDGRRLSSEIIQKISRKHSDDNKIFIDSAKKL
jgi:YfiH family protein